MKRRVVYVGLFSLLLSCSDAADQKQTDETNDSTDISATNPETEPIIDINLKNAPVFPGDCKVEGNIEDVQSWQDKNGTNYFIRTISEIEYSEGENGDIGTRYLWAYHYVENEKGEVTLLKETTDFVKDCEFDLLMSHIMESLTVSDLDGDEIGEITFIYRTHCTSDVSSSTQKLMMLENGDKYPLRGYTRVLGWGGDYEAGEEFNAAPEGFLAHADKIWNQYLVEYENME